MVFVRSAAILTLFFLSVSSLQAEVLPSGKLRLHQSLALVNYGSLYAGDQVKLINAPVQPSSLQTSGTSATQNSSSQASGNVSAIVLTSTASLGLFSGFQLDAELQYKYASITGSEGNRGDGEFEAGISQLGVRLHKNIVNPDWSDNTPIGLNVYLGVRAPGNAPAPADDFLALNDGSTKFDLGVNSGFYFGGVGLEADTALTLRSNADQSPQLRFTLSAPVTAVDGIVFGPFGTAFTTFGGIDIGDADFSALAESTGAPPFSAVKEEYFSVGGFLAVPVSEKIAVDGSLQKKVSGRNTDNSLSIALGLGYNF